MSANSPWIVCVDPPSLNDSGFLEHLLHNIFRRKTAVLARAFFFCQALMRANILDRDGRLRRDAR